jgi:hypothetical protein
MGNGAHKIEKVREYEKFLNEFNRTNKVKENFFL